MIPIEKAQIPQGSQFDTARALELIGLIDRAIDEYDKWNDPDDQKAPAGDLSIGDRTYRRLASFWSSQAFLLSRKEQPFGFIAERAGDDGKPEIFVVFRGTRSGAEWLNNITPNREPFVEGKEDELGQIRTGFRNIFINKDGKPEESIRETITQAFEKIATEARVFVTGHSLGAALATISVQQIRTLPHGFNQPQLYTFASPRVGDTQFATSLRYLEACYRIANTEDLVTVLPLSAGMIFNEQWLLELSPLTRKAIESLRGFLDFVDEISVFDPYPDYQHIGESICFTVQKVEDEETGTNIGGNHNLGTYREALQ
ncbi:MAG: lipase family protein [Cyanobacteria bacterium J06638_22]